MNDIILGDAETVLKDLPEESVDLVFTSPPYFNARPEYSEYQTYEEYLNKMQRVLKGLHRVLKEGCFIVINVSPVLIPRESRNKMSVRLPIPFDFHRILTEEGFDFLDDIVWVKPEGAGWASSRGRRFAADRHPLQYKPVPVTENLLVYRKHTDKLIDWNIRQHDPEIVKESLVEDPYEVTNVWNIQPRNDKAHPAVFPHALAERVIRYYSFKQDVVLDPFAGSGTVGYACARLGRKFILIDSNPEYAKDMESGLAWFKLTDPEEP